MYVNSRIYYKNNHRLSWRLYLVWLTSSVASCACGKLGATKPAWEHFRCQRVPTLPTYTPVRKLTSVFLFRYEKTKKNNIYIYIYIDIYTKKTNKMNWQISECANWAQIISSSDTFFDFGVKFNIFWFLYLFVIFGLEPLSQKRHL